MKIIEKPHSISAGYYEDLLKIKISEDLICDNNHERNTIVDTLRCVQDCVKRSCGLNPMCAHSVNLNAFYGNEAEDLNHISDANRTMENAISYLVNKKLLERDFQEQFQRLQNVRRSMDTILQKHFRQEPILVVNDPPQEIRESYLRFKQSYNPENPQEKKEFMKIKAWIYQEMKEILEKLKEILASELGINPQ